MTFLLPLLYNHYRRRQERRAEARAARNGPAFVHPVLGVGGQSIELSLAVGRPVSPDAVVVAVDDLHTLVAALPATVAVPDEVDVAARFLTSIAADADVDVPAATRAMLGADLDRLEAWPPA